MLLKVKRAIVHGVQGLFVTAPTSRWLPAAANVLREATNNPRDYEDTIRESHSIHFCFEHYVRLVWVAGFGPSRRFQITQPTLARSPSRDTPVLVVQ
jgi:hypothetical protein